MGVMNSTKTSGAGITSSFTAIFEKSLILLLRVHLFKLNETMGGVKVFGEVQSSMKLWGGRYSDWKRERVPSFSEALHRCTSVFVGR